MNQARTDHRVAPVFRLPSNAALATVLFHCASHPAANSRSTQHRSQSRLSCSLLAPIESEQTRKRRFAPLSSVLLVECEIQLQNIHSRVTEDSEISSIGVLFHKLPNFVFAQATRFCYAGDLQFRILQTDVRIEPASRSSDCICRDGFGFFNPFSAR